MSGNRVENLDLLRASAVTMVVFYHVFSLEKPFVTVDFLYLVRTWWSSADLFFVLSGFLIGNLYWKEHIKLGVVRKKTFWQRRWLRTIPPYLVAMHLAYLAKSMFGTEPVVYNWKYLFFLQNYTNFPYFSLSWTLCIEEQFYIFLPLALPLLIRIKHKNLVFFLAFITPIMFRMALPTYIFSTGEQFYFNTHTHSESLVVGVWVAYLLNFQPDWLQRIGQASRYLAPVFLVVILGWNLMFPMNFKFLTIYMFTFLSVGYGMILVYAVTQPALCIARWQPVKHVAVISYSIYLTHALTIHVYSALYSRFLQGWPTWILALLVFGMVYGAGLVFAKLIEQPAIALRDRLVASPTAVWIPEAAQKIS
ncbi:MAG: acyltransferase [Magnetococcales bacterium]|nr:acyltransferase [Magnetococcales bacterium]